jgi:hypothetical protein
MNWIIALRGRYDAGKTTTIRLLLEFLDRRDDFELIRSNYVAGQDRTDFVTVFSYNDCLIGVTSSGDTFDAVNNRLQEFVDEDCQICVCACRTYGQTNTAVEGFEDYEVQYIEKTFARNPLERNEANRGDAELLQQRIVELIDLVNR